MGVDFHDISNLGYFELYYRLRGIRRLDYLVISHYHSDHVGCLLDALSKKYLVVDAYTTAFLPPLLALPDIQQITATGDDPDALIQKQAEIIAALEGYGVNIVHPTNGMITKVGDCELAWYNCDHSIYSDPTNEYYSTNYNDWSICFEFKYGTQVINMTGDLGSIGQRYNGGKLHKCNILKSQHHGWDNGVNNLIPAYINNIWPNLVISETGRIHLPDGQYASSVINASSPMQTWCERQGVPHYLTALNGNIDVAVDTQSVRILHPVTAYIRNDKNWSYSDNNEHQEE